MSSGIEDAMHSYLRLQLESIGVANEEVNRRDWRELLLTAPGLGSFISGVVRCFCCSLSCFPFQLFQTLQCTTIARMSVTLSESKQAARCVLHCMIAVFVLQLNPRHLVFPGLQILHEETLFQNAADGTPFVAKLSALGILPGIKVDIGTVPLPGGVAGELRTQGLDNLKQRCERFYAQVSCEKCVQLKPAFLHIIARYIWRLSCFGQARQRAML